ncbi:flavin reductase family protein [Pseudogemmobacter sonorensis]|uniref:flavin reductase family protein n=1 Tax=Pseudogemmobacter sonorensis TaxID=2989681 RepID=UPI003699A017
MSVTVDAFRAATSARASAIAIVATLDGEGRPVGLAAALVLPVSNDPPQLMVALNRSSQTCAPLLASGAFTVNLLADHHEALCRRFASPDDRDARFADPVWTTLETGMPVLEDALAAFDCRLAERSRSGTHLLVTGTVLALRMADQPGTPLVQYLGRYRHLTPLAGA